MKNFKILIKTKTKRYPVLIGKNIINNFSKLIRKEKFIIKKCLIIVDKNVPKFLVKKLKTKISSKEINFIYFKPNEKNKNFSSVNKILNNLFKHNFKRDDCIISLGGGIIGDISGFAASIYKRGLKFINIPTTLLAQVDSSIGGKTGVNNKYGKNLIGSFYQPDMVFSDTIFLRSLPKRELICGYGEILKHSLIASNQNFIYLKKYKNEILKMKSPYTEKTIFESCKIKKNIVEKDEKEKNLRKTLNFGHTFAHSYEAALSYSVRLNHGEAVILGIISACEFSFQNKFLNKKDYNEIINHIKSLKLKLNINNLFSKRDINNLINFMLMDKKNKSSKINLILLKKIGSPIINLSFTKDKVKNLLKKILINN